MTLAVVSATPENPASALGIQVVPTVVTEMDSNSRFGVEFQVIPGPDIESHCVYVRTTPDVSASSLKGPVTLEVSSGFIQDRITVSEPADKAFVKCYWIEGHRDKLVSFSVQPETTGLPQETKFVPLQHDHFRLIVKNLGGSDPKVCASVNTAVFFSRHNEMRDGYLRLSLRYSLDGKAESHISSFTLNQRAPLVTECAPLPVSATLPASASENTMVKAQLIYFPHMQYHKATLIGEAVALGKLIPEHTIEVFNRKTEARPRLSMWTYEAGKDIKEWMRGTQMVFEESMDAEAEERM